MKKLLSIICILALALSMTGTVWAGEDFSLPETPEEDYGIAPASVSDPSTWVPYEVTGGNIYFDPETQNIVGCDASVTEAVIPAEIDGKAVRMIVSMSDFNTKNSYNYNPKLQKVVISEGISGIAERAFRYCNNLKEIEIPDSVIEIGKSAFEYCASLASIELPSKITVIADSTFYGCRKLEKVVMPNSINKIDTRAFYNCSALESVNIPNSVTTIENYVFGYCSSLKSIDIPASVSYIGTGVFSGCTGLCAINVNEGNRIYYSEDGVLFSGTVTNRTLLVYPMSKPDEEYTVNGSVASSREGTGISGNPYLKVLRFTTGQSLQNGSYSPCILNLTNLKEVYLPYNTGIIGSDLFSQCYAITDVYYDGCAERWEKVKNAAGGNNGSLFMASVHFNEIDHLIQGIELELGETQTVAKFEPVSLAALGASVSYSPQVELYYLGNLLYYDMIDTYHSVSAYFEGNDVKVFVNWPEATEFSVTLIFPDSGSSENLSFNTPEFTLEDIVPTDGEVRVIIVTNVEGLVFFSVYPDTFYGTGGYNIGGVKSDCVSRNSFVPVQAVFPFGSENLPFGGEPSDYEIEIGFSYTVAGSQTQDYYLIGRERLSHLIPHEHIFGDEWKNDARNHWHVCKMCSQTSAPEPHTYANGVCSVCGKEEPPFVLGDVNADGDITLDDAVLTLKVAMNVDIGGETFIEQVADVVTDGGITLDDAIEILKIAMNVIA